MSKPSSRPSSCFWGSTTVPAGARAASYRLSLVHRTSLVTSTSSAGVLPVQCQGRDQVFFLPWISLCLEDSSLLCLHSHSRPKVGFLWQPALPCVVATDEWGLEARGSMEWNSGTASGASPSERPLNWLLGGCLVLPAPRDPFPFYSPFLFILTPFCSLLPLPSGRYKILKAGLGCRKLGSHEEREEGERVMAAEGSNRWFGELTWDEAGTGP